MLAGRWHGQQASLGPEGRRDGLPIPVGRAVPQPGQHQPAQPTPPPGTANPPSASPLQLPQQLLQPLATSRQHLRRDQLISPALVWARPGKNGAAQGLLLVCLQEEKRKLFMEARKTAKSKCIPARSSSLGKVWRCEPAMAHQERGRRAPGTLGTAGRDGESRWEGNPGYGNSRRKATAPGGHGWCGDVAAKPGSLPNFGAHPSPAPLAGQKGM